jgi:hypothetical protein
MSVGILGASECIEVTQPVAFDHAKVVFRGKLIGVEVVSSEPAVQKGSEKIMPIPSGSGDPRVMIFSVDHVWKGQAAETIRIFAFGYPPMGTAYPFRPETRYVVYAMEELSHDSEPIRRVSGGAPVYDLGMCPLRVRTDVEREVRLLEKRAKSRK